MAFLYETHLHTSEASACGECSGAEQAREYARLGYAGVIVTDHFFNGNSAVPRGLPWEKRIDLFFQGYRGTKKAGDALGLDVFLGWEYKTPGGKEFLTYGLDYGFLLSHPGLERMSAEDYSKLVRENGGYLAQAHPFREASYIDEPGAVSPELIDGVEIFNANNWTDVSNEKAAAFAREHNLPVQAGTDAHWLGQDFVSGIILKRRASSVFDIINAVKNKDVEVITPGR